LVAARLFKFERKLSLKIHERKTKVLPHTSSISVAKFSSFSSTSNAHSFNTSLVVTTEILMLCFCRVDVSPLSSLGAKVLSFELVDSPSPSPPAAAADDDAYITYFKTIRKLAGS